MTHKNYQYPKYQKGIYMAFFLFFSLIALSLWIVPIVNLFRNTEKDIIGVLFGLLVGTGLVLGAYIINMMTPDLRVRDDGFQLRTVFYQSQWLHWDDIQFIKKHSLSTTRNRMHGVRIDGIHPVYSFIGRNQRIGGKGFVISGKIQGYDELVQVIETNRPDIFQH